MKHSLYSRIFKQVSTLSVGAGAITSFLSDILIPIAPFALWIGWLAIFTLSLLTIARLTIPKLKPDQNSDGIWFAPLAISGLLFSIMCFSTGYWSPKFKDAQGQEIGVLAGNVEFIHALQKQSGLLEQVIENQQLQLTEQKAINANTKKIENATYFSFKSLNEALISGDLEKIKHFKKEGHNLSIINNKDSEYGAPMIMNMVHENQRNSDEILGYLYDEGVVDLAQEYSMNQNTSSIYMPFWQNFIHNTERVDEHIIAGDSFHIMQEDLRKNYGFIIPSNLESKYKDTVPVKSPNYDPLTASPKYTYTGAWLHGSPTELKVTLYSAALVTGNKKVQSYLERAKTDKLGYYTMPSGTKIILAPTFL